MPIDATDTTFERDVIQRSFEKPVVVDFWAEWCGPCRSLGPVIEKAVDDRGEAVELVKVDTDANPRLSQQFGIQSIPAVKAFKDGKVVDEFVGALPPAQVDRFLDRIVPSEADALVAEGGEANLRRALELEPSRTDAKVLAAWPAASTVRKRWSCSRTPPASPPRAWPRGCAWRRTRTWPRRSRRSTAATSSLASTR